MKKLLFVTLLAAFLAPATASAASKGVYPKWTLSPGDATAQTHSGTIKFGVVGLPDATYKVVKKKKDTEEVELLTASKGGDWLTGATPFGAVFGPSGPSTTIQYLKVGEDSLSRTNQTVTTVTFKAAMPAKLLGITIGDLDVDQMAIQARGPDGSLLSGAHLSGTAKPVPFNFCAVTASKPTNCGSDTNVPKWIPNSSGGKLVGDDNSSDGSSGWLRPDRPVKSITLTFSAISDTSTHSFRLWIAALRPPAPKPRPHYTG